jgi:chromosome segregation ATPase
MDLPTVLQGVASGLLTGGASAGTTFLAVFKDIKRRLTDLEKRLGDIDEEPPTGLFGTVDQLTKSLRSLRNEIDSWRDSPPDWLVRIAVRATSRGSTTTEHWREFEDGINQRLNSFKQTLKRLEDDLNERERRLEEEIERQSSPSLLDSAYVLREEYEADSLRRADEMTKVRDNLRSANSFLRGMMAAMGYLDAVQQVTPPSDPPPPPPPRPVGGMRLMTPGRAFPPMIPPKKK